MSRDAKREAIERLERIIYKTVHSLYEQDAIEFLEYLESMCRDLRSELRESFQKPGNEG